MEMITVIRWGAGGLICAVGLLILGLHCWIFVWGVICRHKVPSALPLVNGAILPIGFLIMPIHNAWQLGLALGLLDVSIGAWVNAKRP